MNKMSRATIAIKGMEIEENYYPFNCPRFGTGCKGNLVFCLDNFLRNGNPSADYRECKKYGGCDKK